MFRGVYIPENETALQYESRVKEEMIYLIDYLQDLQFEIIKARITMESQMNDNSEVELETYDI